jgi:hypothetical protein
LATGKIPEDPFDQQSSMQSPLSAAGSLVTCAQLPQMCVALRNVPVYTFHACPSGWKPVPAICPPGKVLAKSLT